MPLGLQLFSIAQELRQDLDGTLAEVARIGFREVQPAGLHGYELHRFAGAIRQAGLECRSAHLPLNPHGPGGLSLQDLPAVFDAARALGLQRIVVPMFPLPAGVGAPQAGETLEQYVLRATAAIDADHWMALADRLNQLGAELAAHGLRLGYHNHNLEFARFGERSGYETLIGNTDPALVDFELDVGWAASAGLNPVELLRRHPARFGSLHLKDIAASTPVNTRFQLHPADPGAGVIDWPALLRTADELGIGERILEREPPFAEPPLVTLEKCRRHLAALADGAPRLSGTAAAP